MRFHNSTIIWKGKILYELIFWRVKAMFLFHSKITIETQSVLHR